MELWQTEHINKHRVMLIKTTMCTPLLLAKLEQAQVLSREDVQDLELPINTQMAQAKLLYNIVVTRKDSYEELIRALDETKQSGCADILKNHNEKFRNFNDITYDSYCLLGEGSYGTKVYGGKFGGLNVAVKVQNPEFIDEKTVQNEIDILVKLDFHENIVRYYTADSKNNKILIVLERCSISLQDEVEINLIKLDAATIAKKCTKGLAHLHRHNIIHRDLKPANILLTNNKEVKISDFGLSKQIPVGASVYTYGTVGTAYWMAPETLKNVSFKKTESQPLKLDVKTDIFALGCIYYFAYSKGDHPFGNAHDIAYNICHDRSNIDTLHVPLNMLLLIKKMISHEPSKRPSTLDILNNEVFCRSRKGQMEENLYPPSLDMNTKLNTSPILHYEPVGTLERTLFNDETVSTNIEHATIMLNSTSFEEDKCEKDLQGDSTVEDNRHWQRFALACDFGTLESGLNGPDVWEHLHRNKTISAFYYNKYKNKKGGDRSLANIPFDKEDFYDCILSALEVTNHTEELDVLKGGYQKWKKWKITDASITNDDFDSIVEAIGYQCNISVLKKIYEDKDRRHLLFERSRKGSNESLLHVAAACGHLKVIQYLLDIGISVHSTDKYENTPMHYIGKYGGDFISVTEQLLQAGGRIKITGTVCNSLINMMCCRLSATEFIAWIDYLVHKEDYFDTYHDLHWDKIVQEIELTVPTFISLYSMLNLKFPYRTRDGSTLGMLAALHGQSRSVLECLINLGDDWKKINRVGKSVLHYSVEAGNTEAVQLYLSLGADPNEKAEHHGYTPFHYLPNSSINHKEITMQLLKHVGDICAKSNYEQNTVAHVFGRNDCYGKYNDWKDFVKSIGYANLFHQKNAEDEVPP